MCGMKNSIRKASLASLVKENGGVTAFSKMTGISLTYISQMLNGHRNIGEKTARKLELAANKPTGWMDGDVEDLSVEEMEIIELLRITPEERKKLIIPLIKALIDTHTEPLNDGGATKAKH